MKISKPFMKYLKDGFFKCLCLFEEQNETTSQYINSFSYELYGLQYLVNEEQEVILSMILGILEHLYDDSLQPEYDMELIRREIFHCMNNLVNKLAEIGDV